MMPNAAYDFQLEFTGSDDRLEELDQQMSLLLSTVEGTLPLERDLGLNIDFLDKPPEIAKSLYTAELTRKVAKFIPWVRVQEVTWSKSEAGKLMPRVVITSA